MTIPAYRLRLFTSVDLAGSTAFKAGPGKAAAKAGSPHPLWIVVIRKFYDTFPTILADRYRACLAAKGVNKEEYTCPSTWKTIGDEIVFSCRVMDFFHLNLCMLAFVEALKVYGDTLAADHPSLDVKGNAWIAAFPAVNMTATRIALQNTDYLNEQFEIGADSEPSSYDFLGPEIDAGFRVAKHSSPERCALSVQLAWLLTKHGSKYWNMESFAYNGRDILKGVINDKLYPIISLAADRNLARAELRAKEGELIGIPNFRVDKLHRFLDEFMKLENIEFPILPDPENGSATLTFPESYQKFLSSAEAGVEINKRQDIDIEESLQLVEDINEKQHMPQGVVDAAKQYGQRSADLVGKTSENSSS